MRFQRRLPVHRLPAAAATVAAATVLVAALWAGVALARTLTLQVARGAKVTNQSGHSARETIVVTSRGFAVYTLTGDTPRHPECTKASGCFQFWPPVTVASARQLTKAAGIQGKLGTWHRNGFSQVTLAGHPLYTFAPDRRRDDATGEGVVSFGGTWRVVKAR